ncbi:hypothetical protein B0J11DRAFT_592073 [Dendryphion nanum]|uniref:GST C-terminal domain-containing protein n=1 Tax=Dendryphion nanum TaxID=256645 RepID=A0A9P9IDI7_9PLEO|nr:hypothetical protein B0J11DRAFT_592073 [Dendryphion nanum]
MTIPPDTLALTPSTQTYTPTLHNLAHSQAHRVLWILEELHLSRGLTYNVKNYTRSPENREIALLHPLGKAPVLTLELTSSSPTTTLPTLQPTCPPGTLVESKLILDWLAHEYADGLYEPEAAEEKHRDAFWSEFSTSTFTPKSSLALAFDLISILLPWPFSRLVALMTGLLVRHFVSDLVKIFEVMEKELEISEKEGRGEWFAGKKMGLSDVNLTWAMDVSDQKGWFKREEFPRLAKWLEGIHERPAYKTALEKGIGFDLKTFGLKG